MPSAKTSGWRDVLDQAARKARAQVTGHKRIEHVQHGLLVATALGAFGDDPRAAFFIETTAPAANIPKPDLILLHPDVGVLVIENKGVHLDGIHAVENTALMLVRDGRLKEEDPFHQAQKVMYRLRDLAGQRVDLNQALFLHTAALPLISKAEFLQRFETRWPDEALFAEACSDPAAFRSEVLAFAARCQRAARKTHRLSRHAYDAVMTVLSGRGLFYSPRLTYIEATDTKLLGVHVQELDLALKEPTQQQKELGKADLRGSHRLFRGVAGSGKSIMLALNVAHTLMKFSDERSGLFDKQGPSSRVLVVCFNKTLVHYLRQKIESRYSRLTWNTPADDTLTITHFEGLVRMLEETSSPLTSGLSWDKKEERAKAMGAAWDALEETVRDKLRYDAIYVDEAQDLQPPEIELLLRLARPDPKGGQTFALFYDNAQNIYGVTTPVWQQLGVDIVGRTVFLDQCLRNTRETLSLAFNVLVGSYAPEGEHVNTRSFADVASLRQRGLVTEVGDHFEIHFTPRTGPAPVVTAYPTRAAEIEGVTEAVRRLLTQERVIPSDILLLYKSPHPYKDLGRRLREVVGGDHTVRLVDNIHFSNKAHPLIEDGVLTVSTIASAKGYDAPIVFLLGVDELAGDTQGRASFYVGATRAKLCLFASGIKKEAPTLLDEVVVAAATLLAGKSPVPEAGRAPDKQPVAPPKAHEPVPVAAAEAATHSPPLQCKHCKSTLLHAQHSRYGYYFRCIDCAKDTHIDTSCAKCGKPAKVRKQKSEFYRECKACGLAQLIHTNLDLATLETPDGED